MKRIATAAAAGLSSLGLLAIPAAASASAHIPISQCNSRGQFATCVTGGTARHHPLNIYAHVTASPTQSVSVSWDMVCSKGLSVGSKSGSFTTGSPITRRLPKPFKHPDNCSVSADAQLNKGGLLHVALYYTN